MSCISGRDVEGSHPEWTSRHQPRHVRSRESEEVSMGHQEAVTEIVELSIGLKRQYRKRLEELVSLAKKAGLFPNTT